jgi:hypothetical protein
MAEVNAHLNRVSDMKFFQTSEGRLHVGRIAGLVYVVGLVPGCRELEALCLMRIIFTAGWWLPLARSGPRTLCQKWSIPLELSGLF